MIRCLDCGKQFDPLDSMMGDEGQCQLCWEAECSRSWWAMMKLLDEELGPIIDRTASTPWMEVNGPALRASIAEFLEAAGSRRCCSTGIHGHITYGYGPLDEFGFWRYPLADGEYVG